MPDDPAAPTEPIAGVDLAEVTGSAEVSAAPARGYGRALIAVLVLLFIVLAATLFLVIDRADWVDRARDAEAIADENKASARKWKLAAKEFESDANAAGRDIDELTKRQRELAAEKAAIEDERAALKVAVAGLVDCIQEIASAADSYSAGDYSFDTSAMVASCTAARSAMDAAGVGE